MKFDLSQEEKVNTSNMFYYLKVFFESEEGKGIKSIDQVLIKIGSENYFKILPELTDDVIHESKFRGFRFTIDTDLEKHEIEILKEKVIC